MPCGAIADVQGIAIDVARRYPETMTTDKYIKSIEKIIEEHQRIQMINSPKTEAWQNASAEINRLAALIVDAQKASKK